MLDWNQCADDQGFSREAIHLFKIKANEYFAAIELKHKIVLSNNELIKSGRFLKKKDSDRFVASRYALRCLLSKFTNLPPALIKFSTSGNKKPALNGVEFNMTHSQDLILIAISSLAIGIDIEFMNPDVDFRNLADSCFSEKERLHLNSTSDIYKLWTRKEAILKATGEGLNDQMPEVDSLSSTVWRQHAYYEVKTYVEEAGYIFSIASIAKNYPVCFWDFR